MLLVASLGVTDAQLASGIPLVTPVLGVKIGGGCPPTSSVIGLRGRQLA
jgi:hypothetical protein